MSRSLVPASLPGVTRQQILDLYFTDARAKLIDLAAFLDRLERGSGVSDFREAAFMKSLSLLQSAGLEKARAVLEALSDPSSEPIAKAPGKSACGAWNEAAEN